MLEESKNLYETMNKAQNEDSPQRKRNVESLEFREQ